MASATGCSLAGQGDAQATVTAAAVALHAESEACWACWPGEPEQPAWPVTGLISANAAGGLTGRFFGPKTDYLKTFAHQIKTFAHQIKNIGTSDQFI